jgi:hypothetical protein
MAVPSPPAAAPVRVHPGRIPGSVNLGRLWPGALAVVCLLGGLYFALIVAPAGLGPAAPTVAKGLMPEWIGCREILHRRDPYRPELRTEIERRMFGGASPPAMADEHRYAYPAFFVFVFLPMALLPFDVAQMLALMTGAASVALSILGWTRGFGWRRKAVLLAIACGFAAYPTILSLQLRQPTLVICAMLSGVYYCIRSQRLLSAGVLAGLSTAKPQVAIAVLLPLAFWAFLGWQQRKRFVFATAATTAALLIASELLVPGWHWHWLATMKAYSHYAGSNPLLMELLPRRLYAPAAAILVGGIGAVACRLQQRDLLLAISFSIATFQLIFAFQMYNELLLIVPALWVAHKTQELRRAGELPWLLRDLVWVLLGAAWVCEVGFSIADLLAPGSIQGLWDAPLVALWLLPWPMFAVLAAAAWVGKRGLGTGDWGLGIRDSGLGIRDWGLGIGPHDS